MAIRYKIRSQRQIAPALCATELTAMLSCFAQTGDLRAANEGVQGCATAARNLHACMAKPQKSTASKNQSINYLLSRMKK